MFRTGNTAAVRAAGSRSIVGVAPVLHLAQPEPKLSKEAQVKKNTAIALDMIRRFKGAAPAPYHRRHTKSFDEISKEVETLLGGAEKMRRPVTDTQPMDKLGVMERTLRHAIWSYLKEAGQFDFAEMQKWLVYTPTDETRMSLLKRDAELKEKYAAFKAKRAQEGGSDACLPTFNWQQEYQKTVDRELVVEKRLRYDAMSANTTARDDAAIEALLQSYRKPVQDERLDKIVDMLEKFKPILAREAIIQRLTIKHLEGQLGIWRYMDWMPDVRDRAELETDNYCHHWWMENEEKRLLAIRLRSKKEVAEIMEAKQASMVSASSGPAVAGGGKDDSVRQKLLSELLALQAKVGKAKEESKA
jgi:hypothetical protein